MPRLEVSELRKSYDGRVVVDDVSFHVDEGEVFGLIGPNGAGKSTSMSMIAGLLKSDGGTIRYDGRTYNPRDPAMRGRIGMVPQELAIYPDLTALQNLQFFGRLYGLKGTRLRQRVEAVLDLIGLTANANHTPSTFSGGMSRRLNFGIALLHEPAFVVLDEPTVGIDPQSRSNLLDGVRGLSRQGVGVLYASHYMEEVEAVCRRVAILDRGQLLQQGTLAELLGRTRIDLRIRTGPLPAELVEAARRYGEVHPQPDEADIFVREEREETAGGAARSPTEPGAGAAGRLRRILELLEGGRIPLREISTEEMSLETLFLRLTGRKLRD